MTLAAISVYLSLALLASSTPLQLLTPTSPDPVPSTLNLTNHLPLNATALTATAHCFIQPRHPGAPTLLETDYGDCLVAVTVLLADKAVTTPYTFGRRPDADVRLPYAKSFRTCKIIVDILGETETERLRWRDIGDTLEAPRGVLKRCLGQGRVPPLGGRTAVGGKGLMQAIVVGQAWKPGATA
ncbi:MAG: hypothetical protein ALECFALPRED_005316 [Alectoria fallacina]|uniref:Uncharacterized protein n=1 Tax=Alectoria fallacina TaxID=1903189 RepID=A0A8H3FX18_9LECA|nr:MAG: hypothetical protein ALECFALPRED_005316 [Alectoria fallacina]